MPKEAQLVSTAPPRPPVMWRSARTVEASHWSSFIAINALMSWPHFIRTVRASYSLYIGQCSHITCLNLVPPMQPAHQAVASHHLDWSAAAASASSYLILTISKSFWNVLRHVIFKRPLFCLPIAGVHEIATLASQCTGKRSTCPAIRKLCCIKISASFLEAALCKISSFVIQSLYKTRSNFLRQHCWNTSHNTSSQVAIRPVVKHQMLIIGKHSAWQSTHYTALVR